MKSISAKMQIFDNFEKDFPPHSMIFYDFEYYVLKYSIYMTLLHYTVIKLQSKLSQELLTSITTNTSGVTNAAFTHEQTVYTTTLVIFFCYF